MADILGQKIIQIRSMSPAEMRLEGWEEDAHGRPPVLVLSNGVKIYPSRDEEGNGPGGLFGRKGDEAFFVSWV